MKKMIAITLVFALLAAACSRMEGRLAGSSANSSLPAQNAAQEVAGQVSQGQPIAAAAPAAPARAEAMPTPAVTTERKIIRHGQLTIVLEDPADAQRKVAAIAESLGGFVVTAESRLNEHAAHAANKAVVNIVVRVPSAQFSTALDRIRGVGGRVTYENTKGQDVTEEYIDLEARTRTKKALEAQFLEIMKQARKVSDALEVQEKLADVRTEIEQLEGRRRFLENQSSLSTINVTLQPPAPLVTATQSGFLAGVGQAFGDGVDLAAEIVLGLIRLAIISVPILALIVLPLALVWRFARRRLGWLRRPAAEQPAAPQ
jgi:hypothetical protein